MEKKELETLRKSDLKTLLAQRKGLECEKVREIAENFAKSEKNAKKIKEIKQKIAWVETLISSKLESDS